MLRGSEPTLGPGAKGDLHDSRDTAGIDETLVRFEGHLAEGVMQGLHAALRVAWRCRAPPECLANRRLGHVDEKALRLQRNDLAGVSAGPPATRGRNPREQDDDNPVEVFSALEALNGGVCP